MIRNHPEWLGRFEVLQENQHYGEHVAMFGIQEVGNMLECDPNHKEEMLYLGISVAMMKLSSMQMTKGRKTTMCITCKNNTFVSNVVNWIFLEVRVLDAHLKHNACLVTHEEAMPMNDY